jgi:hypothetical protein
LSEQGQHILANNGENLLPGFSVDCVILGFYDNLLKVLLLKPKYCDEWALPGGFVSKEQDVDEAAVKVLKDRTGIADLFLRQFYLFGSKNRNNQALNTKALHFLGEEQTPDSYLLQRFISLGYYALVDFSSTVPQPDSLSDSCEWKEVSDLPPMILDHAEIVSRAMTVLRSKLNNEPIGYNLLNGKFTITELQALYETLLGKRLDRRNFLRRILSYDILIKLDEKKNGVAHKAPNYYSFDTEKYHQALINGLNSGW